MTAAIAPAPRGDLLLGHFAQLRRDSLRFMLDAFDQCGDVARLRFGWVRGHLLAHPDHIRHVLQDHHKTYSKETRGFDKLRIVLGNGLLTSEGDFWLRQRRIMQPAFHKDRIRAFAEVMTRAAEEVAGRWERAARAGAVADVAQDMMRLTLHVVAETLLGTDVRAETDELGRAVTHVLQDVNARTRVLYDVPPEVPTRRNRALARRLAVLDTVVLRAVAEHRAGKGRPGDLLNLLLEARDDDGQGMTDGQIRDEVMTIFLAGHETTANALAWTFHLLSLHPGIDRAMADEIQGVLGGRVPTPEDVPRLEYTTRVIKESMRLYPPAWILGRLAEQDDEIAGVAVPRGTLVFASPYVTHRHPDIWPNPEGFDPDRFTHEREASRARFAYFPFGGGPRICIGQAFAMMEAVLVVATLVQRARPEHLPGHQAVPQPLITLRPRGGLPMRMRMRAE